MKRKIINNKIKIIFIVFILSFSFFVINKHFIKASTNNLSGRILLQVEENGEAWYVNPLDDLRYYLGRPTDAFNLMRSLGLGVSNNDINEFKKQGAPNRLMGRILIQAEDKGQAYYVNPNNLELIYLGRPADAFSIMRELGLGITNNDLEKIISKAELEKVNEENLVKRNYSFKYNSLDRSINLELNSTLYDYYRNNDKSLSYYSSNPPLDLRDSFYGIFLKQAESDNSIENLINEARKLGLKDDQLLEYLISMIQYIPYDFLKVSQSITNSNPYYPYETLYLNKGVCSDKTFLSLLIARQLGYGSAILDFPEANHSALGISCEKEYSVNNSGYCFVETTNYFPFGVVPKNLDEGQAEEASTFDNMFEASHLGSMQIYQEREGKTYYGLSEVINKINNINELDSYLDKQDLSISQILQELKDLNERISLLKNKMDTYLNNNQISKYNDMVPEYNLLVSQFEEKSKIYQENVENYNLRIKEYNQKVIDFYQK